MGKKRCLYIIIFLTVFFGLLLLQTKFSIKSDQYVWDTSVYYNISKSLFINNRFPFLTIENDSKGYVFPVYLFIVNVNDKLPNNDEIKLPDFANHLLSIINLTYL